MKNYLLKIFLCGMVMVLVAVLHAEIKHETPNKAILQSGNNAIASTLSTPPCSPTPAPTPKPE